MASDKLMNHTQGETIITKLTSIADSLDDLAAVTPAKLGMGIATCDTPASTAAKTAALANFALVEGAPVSVQFTYANTATNATLNINNTGAKPIIYKDAAIGNDVISAGDTCTFIYTTNTYKITNIDTLTGPGSGTVRQVGAENGLITDQSDNADIQTTGKIGLNLKSDTAFSTEVSAHNTSTDIMYPVALDSEGHPVAAVGNATTSTKGTVQLTDSVGTSSGASETDVPTEKAVAEAIESMQEQFGTNLPLGALNGLRLKKNDVTTKTWKPKTWGGTELSWGTNMWSDGENIYYSAGSGWQYVLDRSIDTWKVKEWNIVIDYGNYIWTDGENIYYSSGSNQYVLNKSTSTWETKTWSGLTDFNGTNIWTDGDNIYYSSLAEQYVLNKSTSTWETKTWTGLTLFYASNIWTDGKNYYYSYYSSSTTPATNQQYVLDKSTSTWNTKTWYGTMTGFTGNNVWTDGESVYYSSNTYHRKLDVATSTWSTISWSGVSKLYGYNIWTDGKHIYCDWRDSSVTPNVYYNYVLDSVDPTGREVMGYVDETAPSTMGASGTNHKGGLVPDTPSTSGTTKYLCENGSWTVPPGNLSVTYGGTSGTYAETLIFSRS